MADQLLPQDEHTYQMQSAAPQMSSALAAVESSRAVAEVQASLVIAKANPRDESRAEHSIMNSCKRVSLAKTGTYLFRRGGTNVTGPTIRLAEMVAGHWGNINYGFRELDRGKDYSEVEAFAHDLQSNVRVTRQFRVTHTRDKTSGNVALTAERDKYEMVANMAQRRVRACLIGVIPADIFEMAQEACDATLNGSIGDLDKAVAGILTAFDLLGVTKLDVEGYLQRKMESLVPADIVNLRKIHTSIKTGIAPKEEFFREDDVQKLNERFSGNGKGNKSGGGKGKTPAKKKTGTGKSTGGGTSTDGGAGRGNAGVGGDQEGTKNTGHSKTKPTGDPQDTGVEEEPPIPAKGSDATVDTKDKQIPPADAFAEEIAAEEAEKKAEVESVMNSDDGPTPGKMVACPEAGGMMIDSIDCPDAECFDGCKAFKGE